MPEGFGADYERSLNLAHYERQEEDMVAYLEHRLSNKGLEDYARKEMTRFFEHFFPYAYRSYRENLEVLKDPAKKSKWIKRGRKR